MTLDKVLQLSGCTLFPLSFKTIGGFYPPSSESINQYNKITKNGVAHHSLHSQ